jgi:DNA-binding NtrC family response regulator
MKWLKGVKVLVVDDDPDLCQAIYEAFQLAGADAVSARSGNEAISLIAKNSFDFVLSDMRMPNGDGAFVAKEVSKISGPKPLVFLYTGFNDISDSELTELGIAQVFTKPLSVSEMTNSILMKLQSRLAG